MSSIYWKKLQLNSQNSVCIWVIQSSFWYSSCCKEILILSNQTYSLLINLSSTIDHFGQLGLGQQKPREKPNKPKKTILNGLTQDSSHRIVFLVFFGFPRVFGQLGLGQQKAREKPNKPKDNKKNPEWTCPRFFSQDCFFLFWYKSRNFSNDEKYSRKTSKKTTHAKTQRSQRPFLYI